MATKKATAKKTVKKTTAKKPACKGACKCAKKTVKNESHANAYFWGGLAIALCAAGAFIVLAFGVGKMIR